MLRQYEFFAIFYLTLGRRGRTLESSPGRQAQRLDKKPILIYNNGIMNEQHYRRELGLPYDEEKYLWEASNGVGSRSTTKEEAFEEFGGSDLYMATSEALSPRDAELGDLRLEMYAICMNPKLDEAEAAQLIDLQSRVVELEEKQLEAIVGSSEAVDLLKHKLFEELRFMASHGQPVDAEMYVEADVLANTIAAALPDKSAADLAEVFDTMQSLIDDLRTLESLQANYHLAA